MADCTRHIPLAGVKNFRDIGGYDAADGRKIRWGRLFRSGHLSDMTESCGTEMVARDIEVVIDFRSAPEKERHPVHWPVMWVPDYQAVPIGGNAAAWVKDLLNSLSSAAFPGDELRDQFILAFQTIPVANADGLKKMFDILVDETHGNGTLVHCTAGKDRTGIAFALIMEALGVPDDQIMENFLATNKAVDLDVTAATMAEWISTKAGRQVSAEMVKPLVGVEEAFLHAAYAVIEEKYGSRSAYLQDVMGLTPQRLSIFRDKYLSDDL